MGFDKDRRPIWMPGRRDRMFTVAGTSVTIPSYGFNLFKASTVAGTKKFLLANPLPFTGSGGTEVNIISPNLITGTSCKKNVVVASTRTSIIFNTTKPYKKATFAMATPHRGVTLRMISISTATYYVIAKSTAISLSTSST